MRPHGMSTFGWQVSARLSKLRQTKSVYAHRWSGHRPVANRRLGEVIEVQCVADPAVLVVNHNFQQPSRSRLFNVYARAFH
jgi:hypothetical protein